MTKRSRTILFSICLILFFLITPTIIFYSLGFRFDFDNKKITQTGGLFLSISPASTEIFVNNEFIKKTDFLSNSVLVKNLLPKKYKVRIEKDGYNSWEKNLEVNERQVTEAKNIILFPKNINFEILEKKVNNFWLSPDERKIIFYEISENGWDLKLYDLGNKNLNQLINERGFASESVNLLNLEFSADSRNVYLTVGISGKEQTFILNLTSLSLTEKKEDVKFPEEMVCYQTVNNDIYYLDDLGNLYKTDKSFNLKTKLNEKPFQMEKDGKCNLRIFRGFIFLEKNKNLYIFDENSKFFDNFFENISDLRMSPDSKILAYFSNSELWILFLEDKFEQPTKKRGEKLFLTRLSEKIENLFWINSDYLIFNSEDKIKIIEVDDRDKINALDLAEFPEPKISFNKWERKIYVLSNGHLSFSVPLF